MVEAFIDNKKKNFFFQNFQREQEFINIKCLGLGIYRSLFQLNSKLKFSSKKDIYDFSFKIDKLCS